MTKRTYRVAVTKGWNQHLDKWVVFTLSGDTCTIAYSHSKRAECVIQARIVAERLRAAGHKVTGDF